MPTARELKQAELDAAKAALAKEKSEAAAAATTAAKEAADVTSAQALVDRLAAALAALPTDPAPVNPSWVAPGAAVHLVVADGRCWVRGRSVSAGSEYGVMGELMGEIEKIRAQPTGMLVLKTSGGMNDCNLFSTTESTFDMQMQGGKIGVRLADAGKDGGDLFTPAMVVPADGKLAIGWAWATGFSEVCVNGGAITRSTRTHIAHDPAKGMMVGSSTYGDRVFKGAILEIVAYDDAPGDDVLTARCKPSSIVAPPPIVVPPVVTTPAGGSFAPIAGKTLNFDEDFTGGYKANWNTFAPFGDPNTSSSRRYGHANQAWIATDPDYTPDLPSPINLIPGGGLELLTIRNPKPGHPKLQAYGQPDTFLAGWIWSKTFQRAVNSYTEYEMTLCHTRGSFSSGWSWTPDGAHEIDTWEQLGIWADRFFWGCLNSSWGSGPTPFYQDAKDFRVKDANGLDTSAPQPMTVTGVRSTFGSHWTPQYIDFYINRIFRGRVDHGGRVANPQFLCVNNVEGGWDGQEDHALAADLTRVVCHRVRNWQG